jgi:hypothetical protein
MTGGAFEVLWLCWPGLLLGEVLCLVLGVLCSTLGRDGCMVPFLYILVLSIWARGRARRFVECKFQGYAQNGDTTHWPTPLRPPHRNISSAEAGVCLAHLHGVRATDASALSIIYLPPLL